MLAFCFVVPNDVLADRATDLVFSNGVLSNIPQDKTVTYNHLRLGPEGGEFHSIADGQVLLVIVPSEIGGDEVILEMLDNGQLSNRTPFPADAGNPIVMAFLESSLRSMAQITGGSPFYLRNRIKESLRSGGQIEPLKITIDGASIDARKITFMPFINDKNAAKMGDFAKLELVFVVSESVPGGFVLFSANTPETDGKRIYQESMRYSSLTDQE
jgi:hypothetical protein